MLRGDIRQQQEERMVRGRVLIRRGAVEMLGRHFSETGNAFAEKFFRALLEFFLNGRTRVSGGHRFHDHCIQGSAAAEDGQFTRILLRSRKHDLRVKVPRMIECIGQSQEE